MAEYRLVRCPLCAGSGRLQLCEPTTSREEATSGGSALLASQPDPIRLLRCPRCSGDRFIRVGQENGAND